MPRPKFAFAQDAADRCLAQIGVEDPSAFPIKALTGALRIGVRHRAIDGARGRLVRGPEASIIVVSTEVAHIPSQRFVIAHELGHHQLHGARSQLAMCSADGFVPSYREPEGPEAEASAFARAFLMPARLARPICTAGEPGFDTIRELNARFQVSLTAAALRFLQLTDERCAVVFSRKGYIQWFSATEDFEYWIPFNTPLDHRSYAYDASRGRGVPSEPEAVSATAWISRKSLDGGDDIYEESVPMQSLDAVLSVLWIPPTANF